MTAETAPAPATERTPDELVGRLSTSTIGMVDAAMIERPTAATGNVLRADTMRRLAEEAGFASVERLDESMLEGLRFYRLTP